MMSCMVLLGVNDVGELGMERSVSQRLLVDLVADQRLDQHQSRGANYI